MLEVKSCDERATESLLSPQTSPRTPSSSGETVEQKSDGAFGSGWITRSLCNETISWVNQTILKRYRLFCAKSIHVLSKKMREKEFQHFEIEFHRFDKRFCLICSYLPRGLGTLRFMHICKDWVNPQKESKQKQSHKPLCCTLHLHPLYGENLQLHINSFRCRHNQIESLACIFSL